MLAACLSGWELLIVSPGYIREDGGNSLMGATRRDRPYWRGQG